jgi:hypothetical protein
MMLQVRAMQEAAALAAAAAPPLSRDPLAAGARTSSTTTSTTTSSNSVTAAAAAAMTSQATSQQLQPVTVDPADADKIYALFLRGMFGYRYVCSHIYIFECVCACMPFMPRYEQQQHNNCVGGSGRYSALPRYVSSAITLLSVPNTYFVAVVCTSANVCTMNH